MGRRPKVIKACFWSRILCCHGNAKKTINTAHFALFGLFLTISGHIFLFLIVGPCNKQNYTLHTIWLDDTISSFINKTLFVVWESLNSEKYTKMCKSGTCIFMISELCHGNVCILNEKVVPYFESRDINLLFAILFLANYKILNFTKA